MNRTVDARPDLSTTPLISVVIPVRNGEGKLEHCLASLGKQSYPKDRIEVIVADGMSTDRTQEIARSFGARVVPNPQRTVAGGRNAGIREARGEIIAFTDDDCILPEDWVRIGYDSLLRDSADGVGGPTPLPPNAPAWSQAVNAIFRLASRLNASVQSDRRGKGECTDLPGGNAIYRRQALEDVLPLNERLVTAEDVDMHLRMRDKGLRLHFEPRFFAYHHKRDTPRGFLRQMRRFAVGRVQLGRIDSRGLRAAHWAAALGGGLALLAVVAALWFAPAVALWLMASGWLLAAVAARALGESRPVAVRLAPAVGVFVAGWTTGFWQELLEPANLCAGVREWRVWRFAPVRGGLKIFHAAAVPACLVLVGLFLVVKLVLLFRFALHGFYVMDEYQQGGYSQYIADGFYRNHWPFKTVLYAYFYLPARWMVGDAVGLLRAMRLQTAALAVGSLGLLYGCARAMGRNRLHGLLVVASALAFSNFMERCYRLRAEPFALFWGLAALWVSLHSGRPFARQSHRLLVAGSLCGLAFLSTQKAVWFALALGVGWAFDALLSRQMLLALRRGAWLFGGWALCLLAYATYFRGTEFYLVLRHVFLRPMDLALHGGDAYFWVAPQYIHETLVRNWIPYLLCLLAWLIAGTRLLRADTSVRVAWVVSGTMTLLVFTHNQPWPYVFILAIPFMALWVPELSTIVPCRSWETGTPLVLMLLFGLSLLRNFDFLAADNRYQNEVVSRAEQYLRPGDRYCDGIGMIPTRRLVGGVWWDSQRIDIIHRQVTLGDRSHLDRVFSEQPKLLIHSYRTVALHEELAPYLKNSFVPLRPNLLMTGVRLSAGQTKIPFVNRWAGRYAVYDSQGTRTDRAFRIDGTWVTGVAGAHVAAGSVLVEIPDCEACFLLPADLGSKVEPATVHVFTSLFDNVYSR